MPLNNNGDLTMTPQDVTGAASLISGMAGSGNAVAKALPILDPLVFGVIGSSVGAANSSLEDGILGCIQGVLGLFSNTSGDIQAAVDGYQATDSDIGDDLASLDTDSALPPDADVGAFTDDIPVMGGWSSVGEFGFPAGGGLGALGALAEDASLGEFDSAVLARLAGEEMSMFTGQAERLLGSELMSMFRGLSGEPSAVSAAWGGLTEEEQEAAIAADRAAIGALDGIPSAVRSAANAEELDDLVDATAGEIEELRASAQQADDKDDDEKALLCLQQAAVLQIQLAGLQALKSHLQASPDAFLLAIGTDREGTGRYIIAVNNPDTADNVATLVPSVRLGLSDGPGGVSGSVSAAVSLAAAAGEADRGQVSSVIVWANYSAPVFVEADAPAPDPEAAPVLSQFLSGLAAAGGAGLHTTVIAVQAGAVLVGAAAKLEGGLNAGDVIALGHPGLDPGAMASLRAGGGGANMWVYAGEGSDGDPADYFGSSSPAMTDMAHIVVGAYDTIYSLSRNRVHD